MSTCAQTRNFSGRIGFVDAVLVSTERITYISGHVWREEEKATASLDGITVGHTRANKLSHKLSKGEALTSLTPRFLHFPKEEKRKLQQIKYGTMNGRDDLLCWKGDASAFSVPCSTFGFQHVQDVLARTLRFTVRPFRNTCLSEISEQKSLCSWWLFICFQTPQDTLEKLFLSIYHVIY